MNDSSGLLAPDFGYKSQSKSAPMSSSKPSSRGPTRSPWNAAPEDSDSLFSSSSDGRGAPSSSINFDSIFGGSSGSGPKQRRCLFTISRFMIMIFSMGCRGLIPRVRWTTMCFRRFGIEAEAKRCVWWSSWGFWEEGPGAEEIRKCRGCWVWIWWFASWVWSD